MAGRGAGRPGFEHHRRPPARLGFPSELFQSTTPHPLFHTIKALRAFESTCWTPARPRVDLSTITPPTHTP